MTRLPAAVARATFLRTAARGNSMRPTVCDREELLVRRLNGRAPEVGSILLGRIGPRLIAHRLVRLIRGDREPLILQGDCSLCPDPPMSLSQIVGEAVAVVDRGAVRRLDRGPWRWFGLALVRAPLFRQVWVRAVWRISGTNGGQPSRASAHVPLAGLITAADGPGNRSAVKDLLGTREVDWDLFVELADAQGVSARAYRRLMPCRALVPDRVLGTLRSRYALVMRHGGQQLRETRRILGELGGRGVSAIVLKGPLVTSRLGLDIGARPSSDIDLLVRPEDRTSALQVLSDLGYCHESTFHSPRYLDEVLMRTEVSSSAASSLVELHWNPFPRRPVLFDDRPFWQRSESGAGAGGRARFLSPTDLLLYECIHLCAHGYAGLKYLSDIADLLARRGNQVDWEEIVRSAEANRKRNAVFFALTFGRQIAGAAVPTGTLDRLAPGPAVRRWQPFLNGFQQARQDPGPRSVREVLVELATADSIRDSALIARQSLFLDPGERARRSVRTVDRAVGERGGASRAVRALRAGARMAARTARRAPTQS